MAIPGLPPTDSRLRVRTFLQQLQEDICRELQVTDGKGTFQEDSWERPDGGGGRSRVLEGGALLERGGVNFSEVWGKQLPPSIIEQRPEAKGHEFYATGTSLVLHPRNPYVPTVHLNYRYFEAGPVWWFGGGADLTPYYPFREDAVHFHHTHKCALESHHPEYYPVFKRWCDEYFYLKHRQEMRGIGGIFLDYQDGAGLIYRGSNSQGNAAIYSNKIGELAPRSWDDIFGMIQSCGHAFLTAYLPIVERRRGMVYGERERQFQLYRRGRYVEFNLIYDRGTIFGLQTNGRTESILMSMPPLCRWEYSYTPAPGTSEAELTDEFLKPQDWLAG